MDKLPGKIWLYLLMLLLVTAALKMKGADAKTGGMPPGQTDEHDHSGEDVPAGIPVLLEFTSPTCDICKQMKPIMEKLREEYAGKVAIVEILVNSEETQRIADSYGVEGFPSFFLLNNKDDKIVMEHFEGGFPEEMLRKLLDAAPSMKPSIPTGGGVQAPGGGAPGKPMAAPEGGGASDPYDSAPEGGVPQVPGSGTPPPAK